MVSEKGREAAIPSQRYTHWCPEQISVKVMLPGTIQSRINSEMNIQLSFTSQKLDPSISSPIILKRKKENLANLDKHAPPEAVTSDNPPCAPSRHKKTGS